jgi:glycerophosphoryl diester phosphodiesterase
VLTRAFPGRGPAVLGHRGLGCGVVAGLRENTLDSFVAAVRLGVPWVEADVRRTRDDVLVVEHDACYPDGTPVAAVTTAEADARGTLRLQTLLDELPAAVGVDLDLKSSADDGLRPAARTTAGLLGPVAAAEKDRRPLLVSSFDPAALWLLRRTAPGLRLAWLTWHYFPLDVAVAACAHLDVDVLGLHIGSLLRASPTGEVDPVVVGRAVDLLHRCRRELLVWCPEGGPARLLAEAGADALVVDPVPSAMEALAGVSAA